jgi:endonuclease YncB( thermonuclease family)
MMAKISTAMPSLLIFVLLVLSAVGQITTANADAVKAGDVHVIDGDTIDAVGKRIRLVGFDAPELGDQAHCGRERRRAVKPMRSSASFRPAMNR